MENKDYVGKCFDCVFNDEIRRCEIVDEWDDKSFLAKVVGDYPNAKTVLYSEEINLNEDENWIEMTKQKIERSKKLLKEYHESLDQRYYRKHKKDKSHQAALAKNERLSEILHDKRETMCGVGARQVKLTLNKLIKQGNRNAELYRKALEVEDCNIRAKESSYYYKDKIYRQKSRLLMELVDLCLKYDVVFGKQMVEGRETNCILYFELPFVEQISFHTTLGASEIDSIPDYQGQWDGKTCSTLDKLESALMLLYYNKTYSRLY